MPHRHTGLDSSHSESAPDQLAAHRRLTWWVFTHAISKATITGSATPKLDRLRVAFGLWQLAVA
jgi:hypothetical protein